MDRTHQIFQAIVKHFIETGNPVGSETIVMGYHFAVSSATIRNEMATLEKEGLLTQPHTSAGRIPTDLGYRVYVNENKDLTEAKKEAEKVLTHILKTHQIRKAREKIYDAVSILADATENVSFATLPDNDRTFFLGVSNVMKQPEFLEDPVQASQVIEVLEEGDRFVRSLQTLDVPEDKIKIFIGRENLLRQIQSCAIVVTRYCVGNFEGYIGILGPTRMRYPFHYAVLEKVKELLRI